MITIRNLNPRLPASISPDFIYRCMGFGESRPDTATLETISKCEKIILNATTPRAIACIAEKKEIWPRLEGKLIKEHLDRCDHVVLFAVTLGVQIDRLIHRYEITDMLMAMTLDSCASSLVEDICDDINSQLEILVSDYLMVKNTAFTSRFSPGYGDWPLSGQLIFDEFLDMHRTIGLSQSKEHLLIPRKSVTAIFGIQSTPAEVCTVPGTEPAPKACQICILAKDCQFRKSGAYCGKALTAKQL